MTYTGKPLPARARMWGVKGLAVKRRRFFETANKEGLVCSKQELRVVTRQMATKKDVGRVMVMKEDLETMATKEEVEQLVTNEEMGKLVAAEVKRARSESISGLLRMQTLNSTSLGFLEEHLKSFPDASLDS